MKASKESLSRLCPLGDVSLSAARWGVSGVAFRVSDVGFPVGLAAAPPPSCLRLREVLGSPGGRRTRDLWLMVDGDVHTLAVRSRSLRFRVRPVSAQRPAASVCRYVRWVGTLHCRPVHSPARFPHWCWRWCPLRGPPHFFRAHRGLPARRLGWQCRRFGFIVRRLRCPSGVAFRHGRRLGSVFRARGLWGARRGGGACRVRVGAPAGGWATGR